MENNTNEKVYLNVDEFIDQHPEFFDSEFKKSVFMLGNLTERLLAKQREKYKSEPFSKHLNGLNIDKKIIQKIFPKLINKLKEHEVHLPELERKNCKIDN